MRKIDMQTWSRRKHFEVFSTFDFPHFNLCANVDLTLFYPFVKQHSISINVAIVYLLTRAANLIPEFRYRIHGDEVVEHEVVHPSSTVLTDDELFTFCTMEYVDKFSAFAAKAAEKIAYVKENPTLEDKTAQDNLLFMTSIPWVSFTNIMHPIHLYPADSVPRIAWGKYFNDDNKLKMPLSVQAHHALMDGIHVGKYYTKVQGYLHEPEVVLGKE
jgi:chloramphenicol O-acetyltransferase type A